MSPASNACFVTNVRGGKPLAEQARIANTFFRRFRGLLFKPPLAPGQALLLSPCSSVHTFGMRYAVDVVFVDRAGRVLKVREDLGPCRVALGGPGAFYALELPAGACAKSGLRVGDPLRFEPI